MKKILYTAAIIVALTACRKQPDLDQLTLNPIVVTNHNESTNFSAYKTYYLSDNITLISDNASDTIAPSSVSTPIVNAIVSNMTANGYTRVSTTTGADLGVNAAIITISSTVTTYPPTYWWGYPGYGGCYYGYCGYYPYYGYGYYPYSYSYTTGSLIVEMADLVNVYNQKLQILWTNWNTGVLTSTSNSVNTQAAVNSVNQAFKQSPYLKIN